MPLVSTTPYFVPEGPEGLGIRMGGNPNSTTVTRYDMSTDTDVAAAQALPSNIGNGPAGFCDGINAYHAGGNNSGSASTITQKHNISGNTTSSVASSLSAARTFITGFSNTVTGVAAGGTSNYEYNHNTYTALINKFAIGTETWSVSGSTLGTARMDGSGYGNTTDGWSCGGIHSPNPISVKSSIRVRYNYVGDTTHAATGMILPIANTAAGSNSTLGLTMGGNTGSNGVTRVEKFTFIGETNATGTNLLNSHRSAGAFANPYSCLVAGSTVGSSTRVTSYVYGTDTVTNKGDVLSTGGSRFAYSSTAHGGI